MVSASQDSTVRLWSLELFTCIAVFRGHIGPVWDIDAAPNGCGPYFVTAAADRTARLWSSEHTQALRVFAGHLSDVDCVRFHPNGNYVITGSSDKTVRVWDIQTGSCTRLFTGHTKAVSCLACSPDGRYVASGDQGGFIKIWDISEGRLTRTIQGKLAKSPPAGNRPLSASTNCVYSLCFDRDGKLLTSSGSDQVVRIWDMAKLSSPSQTPAASIEECTPLLTFSTKQTPVLALQFNYRNVLIGAGPFLVGDLVPMTSTGASSS